VSIKESAMEKKPPKKRKEDSVNEAPSQPDGIRRPSEGGVGREYRDRSGDSPPSSTKL
jgi:hypothetical protein